MRRNFIVFLVSLLLAILTVLAIQAYIERRALGATNHCVALENTLNDLIEATASQSGFQVGAAMRAAGFNELNIAIVASRMGDADIQALTLRKFSGLIQAKRDAVLLFSGCR